jgi:hypothetical protein
MVEKVVALWSGPAQGWQTVQSGGDVVDLGAPYNTESVVIKAAKTHVYSSL